MTESNPDSSPETDVLPPEEKSLSVPPPVPQKKPGLLRRLFTSRKKQQAVAIQNGYLEMVDLIRSIRTHLDRQEDVQTRVLGMLEKVPDTMERQHEVMNLFKEQLQGNLENDKKLTESMGRLNDTLSSMDDSQKASARTVTDLIHRSRESEQLLREVMRRSERRVTFLLVLFFLAVIGLGFYFLHWQNRPAGSGAGTPVAAAVVAATAEPAEAAAAETTETEPATPPKAEAPEFKSEDQADAEAKADADQKAEEKKQQAEEKAREAEAIKKADELKAREKAAQAEEKRIQKKKEAAEKEKAAELKAQKKAERERKKAEKKAKAEQKQKAKEAREKAEKEAKARAEQEAKTEKEKTEAAAAAKKSEADAPEAKSATAMTPEFTLERIQPPADEPVSDKPVSLP